MSGLGDMILGPTIPQLARKLGVPRRSLFHRLLSMHGRDRASDQSFIPWLYRAHGDGTWHVNLSRLRNAHPEMFDAPSNEELGSRVRALESRVNVLDAGQMALAGRVREMRSRTVA